MVTPSSLDLTDFVCDLLSWELAGEASSAWASVGVTAGVQKYVPQKNKALGKAKEKLHVVENSFINPSKYLYIYV